MFFQEVFDNTKGAIRIRISKKNRQHNQHIKWLKEHPPYGFCMSTRISLRLVLAGTAYPSDMTLLLTNSIHQPSWTRLPLKWLTTENKNNTCSKEKQEQYELLFHFIYVHHNPGPINYPSTLWFLHVHTYITKTGLSRNCLPFRSAWVHPRFLVGFVLLDH
jgi:hypothetical protein